MIATIAVIAAIAELQRSQRSYEITLQRSIAETTIAEI